MKLISALVIIFWILILVACSPANEVQPIVSPTLYTPIVYTTVPPSPTETVLPNLEPTFEAELTPTESSLPTEPAPAVAPAISSWSSVTISGITINLVEFNYDESSASVIFCYTLPSWNHNFDRPPSLYLDGNLAPFSGGGTYTTRDCEKHDYSVGRTQIEAASEITFSMEGSFRWDTQDENTECEKVKSLLTQTYLGLDFTCSFSMAGYVTNLKVPSSLSREQANTLIVDTIEQAVYGPWVIRIK